MSRLFVCALILSLGNTSVAFARESLLESAKRAARELADADRPPVSAGEAKRLPPALNAQTQQTEPALVSSGLSTRSKILIAVAAAAAFAGVAYTIDQRVEDHTPSTRGERQDFMPSSRGER